MIVFECPNCLTRYTVSDDKAGRSTSCAKCRHKMKVPEPELQFADDHVTASANWQTDTPSRRVVVREEVTVREESRRRGYECPFCGSDSFFLEKTRVSTAGWVTFCIVLLLFFPLCWVGLLIREPYRVCGSCGSRLG